VPRITKLVSFWAFVALAALLALQAFPVTGIFLMMFGAALLSGALVHIFLLSLFFEAVGRVPRFLMILPVAAYGAYYAVYFHQGAEIAGKSAELKASNPSMIMDFNPSSHSLVTAEANTLVQRYAIPVAYEANSNFQPEGHLSFRLIRRDQCNIRRDSQSRIQTFGMHFGGRFQQNVCVLRFPEAPTSNIVRVERRGDDEVWKRKWGISQQVTEISVDGKALGTYRSASVWRLPALPLGYIGCALISSTPAWKCGADFKREHVVIDVVPAGIDRQSYDSAVSIMLGLKKYTESDLAGFRGYELNDAALVRVAGEPDRVEDEMFRTLEAIIDGQNPRPPHNLGDAVGRNPSRLVPLTEKLAARFVELNQADARRVSNHQEQARALAMALTSLPRAAFLGVSDQIFGVIQEERSWDRYPALYVRTGDIGVKAFEFYKKDFIAGKFALHLRMLPVLAICRIGLADDETIAEMKRRLVAIRGRDPRSDDEYKSAIFVTLMKLGEESFLRESIQSVSERLGQWADAVLEGKGATETGPNNCMAQRGYQGPMMAPGLQLIRGVWSPRAQTN
jgi:hypothetical protein